MSKRTKLFVSTGFNVAFCSFLGQMLLSSSGASKLVVWLLVTALYIPIQIIITRKL